jgi:uncharacterized membrane-anchored protein YjiN (DUF445 family)
VPQLDALERTSARVVPPLAREDERRRRLTVMRGWATGTLVVVTMLWLAVVIVQPSGDWTAYVRAGLEASMVGALADWFAVTALFRHPLRLPIPHTAIVVERKEQFGQTLASFFRENFLGGAAIAERVRTSAAVERASTWLADRQHATTPIRYVLLRVASALHANDERVVDTIVTELRRLSTAVPVAAVSAAILRAAAESPQLDDGIDATCAAAQRAILDNADELQTIIASDRPWWLPELVQRRLVEHFVDRAVSTLDTIRNDPAHPARRQLRTSLTELAHRLEHDPAFITRLHELQRTLADDSRVNEMLTSVVAGLIDRFHDQARTPASHLEERLVDLVTEAAARVRDDPAMRARIEDQIEALVDRAMAQFGDDVDALVTGTISRWDAARTADQLELLLGPDLQYIRINGAVVGGLAGLLLHSIAQVIG